MAETFSYLNLMNNQVITLPYEVTGAVSVNPGGTAYNILSLAYEIDDNALVDICANCTPDLTAVPTPAPQPPAAAYSAMVSFSFELSTTDCPTPGNYILTLISQDDDTSVNAVATTTSIAFQVGCPVSTTTMPSAPPTTPSPSPCP